MTTLRQAPIATEDRPVVIRRWVLRMAYPTIVMVIVALVALSRTVYGLDQRVLRIENTPDPRVLAVEQRTERIEKLLALYEQLRIERERQIAELQTEQRNMKETIDQMRAELNGKLDRLLFGSRRP